MKWWRRLLTAILRRLVVFVHSYVYVSRDNYIFDFGSPEELNKAIEADLRNEADRQEMPDYSEFFWVLNVLGLREVFAIARAEPNDELALLTLAANTDWTMRPGDIEEDDEV